MELLVQKYLRSGKSLSDLKLDHGVKSFVQNGKISLTYDQLEAKDADLLSQQCRGLILSEANYEVIAAPMFRFFNLEQSTLLPEMDWDSVVFEEKLDGTLIILYWDENAQKWYVATRSRPEADVSMDGETFTFSSLTDLTLKTMFGVSDLNSFMNSFSMDLRRKTFCFELCSPYNRIVCDYKEPTLTLLAVKGLFLLKEEDPLPYSKIFNIPTIKTYAISHLLEMIDLVKSWDPKEHEGIVAKDKFYNRIKVKNPAYVAFNHMRDSLSTSYRGCAEIILLGKDDDVVAMLPGFIADRIQKLKPLINEILQITQKDYNDLCHIEDMKQFALEAQSKLWPAALFALKRKKTSDLISFAKGNNKGTVGVPQSSLDQILNLCTKLDPTFKEIKFEI